MSIPNVQMYRRVSSQLESSYVMISPSNEWFKQCLDFFISENPNCDAKDLSSMVVEQLSLADFQQVGLSSLPTNLNNCNKTVLNGKYCLQVNTILDVGQSCYSQYNTILKRDTSNAEIGDTKPAPWEPKLHRMLKMMCTDGQQDIMAMEYENLPCLKEPFVPGFKIAVIGPVECRKGVLLLKPKNVRFIGGEVDHLLIKNAPLNVLCRTLNKTELENPYMFSNIEVENSPMEIQESYNINPLKPTENINRNDIRPQISRTSQHSTNQCNDKISIGNGVITYDDFFDNDEDLLYLTQVAEIETGIAQSKTAVNLIPVQTFNTNQQNSKLNKPKSLVPEKEIFPTESNKKTTVTVRQTKISDILAPSTSNTKTSSLATETTRKHDSYMETYNTDAKQMPGKREASSPVNTEPKRPSIEFHETFDDWDDVDMDTFSNSKVKVLNSTSVIKNSKIQVKQNEWICSGIVLNETKREEVEFSSKVLERLIGVTSEEVLQFKNSPHNCAQLKEKIEKGIKGAYRKLHLYKDKMTLTYSSDKNQKPLVTDMVV